MIVRVMEEDQYRLDDIESHQFEQLDQALLAAVRADDHVQFIASRDALLAFVREHGDKVGYIEIVPSDIVVPAEDITLQEAKTLLIDEASPGGSQPLPEENSENAE
ncbi:MAG: hypothetical protein H0U76_08290 [Ktedonobacteraceae bacterium]|nr:hypothetical protein [Ktedonobacteraceae bacterium]MBA3826144.1 hypothetical protein [Ktedonobacterales bacterium]